MDRAQRRAETLRFKPATRERPRASAPVNLVVVDAATGRPVQALKIGC